MLGELATVRAIGAVVTADDDIGLVVICGEPVVLLAVDIVGVGGLLFSSFL